MKKIITLFSVLIFLTLACTSDFENLNVNKQQPEKVVSPSELLPSAIFQPLDSHMQLQIYLGSQLMQYMVFRNDNNLDAYDFSYGQNLFTSYWKNAYRCLLDIADMNRIARQGDLETYLAAGKIIAAFHLATMTELWINVPYSKAFQGLSNIQPAYDKQEDIYKAVLNNLEEANTLLSSTNTTFNLGGDNLFGGNVMKWRKMANSLRLRYLLRLSKVTEINAATEIKTIIEDPVKYPIFESNDDSAIYDFTISPNISSFSRVTNIGGVSPSQRLVFMLDGINPDDDGDDDPRLAFFSKKPLEEPTTGPYIHQGVISGSSREAAQSTGGNAEKNASLFTERFQENQGLLDFTFMSYAELQFILSEVALSGWISADAQSFYEKGIESNLDYWNIAMPAGFLSRGDVAWDGTLERLMDQKWIAMFMNNTLEAWGDYKRTGLPALTIGPLATTVTQGVFPTRILYPTKEQSVNTENYKAAVEAIGGDSLTAKHWYQN